MAGSTDTENCELPVWACARTAAAEAFERLSDATEQKIATHRSLQLSSDHAHVVYFVMEGWLVVSKSTEEGQRQIVDFILPGEVFDPASAKKQQSATDLTALTSSRVSMIPQASWHNLLQDHHELQELMNRHMAASYARIAERLLRVGKGHAESRIAYAICELCLRSTKLGLVDGKKFHLPVTQQVLGDFVGLSSVHVSRTLRRLRRDQVITTGDHLDIVIEDVDRLAEVAEVDLDDLRAEIITAV
jgi:CRP-like cAMP-binding protein